MVSLAFSGNAGVQSHSLRMDNKVTGLVADVKKWRDAEKLTIENAKKAKKHATKAKEAKKKTENKLASA